MGRPGSNPPDGSCGGESYSFLDEEVIEDPVLRDGGIVLRGKIAMPKVASKGCGGGGCRRSPGRCHRDRPATRR